MADAPTSSPGTLFIHMTSNTQVLDITNDIPLQTIFLRGYRIELSSAANALAEKVLYLGFEPNIFNGDKMMDTNKYQVKLPIMLDNAAVTHTYSMNIPVPMTAHIPMNFRATLYDGTFQPVANLVSASFQFYMSENNL